MVRPNISPMGPAVDRELTQFLFRPFSDITDLPKPEADTVLGVFHVVDDVLLCWPEPPPINCGHYLPRLVPAEAIDGVRSVGDLSLVRV